MERKLTVTRAPTIPNLSKEFEIKDFSRSNVINFEEIDKKEEIINNKIPEFEEKKIFEHFFIIGISKETIENHYKLNKSSSGFVSANILYNYPKLLNPNCPPDYYISLPDLVFPFGAHIQNINYKSNGPIYELNFDYFILLL